MMNPCRRAGLAAETLGTLWIEREISRESLQRHPAAQGLLHRLEDHAHGPAANFADDPVVAEPAGSVLGGSLRLRLRARSEVVPDPTQHRCIDSVSEDALEELRLCLRCAGRPVPRAGGIGKVLR